VDDVIAGFEVLTAMEKVPTDDDDRPKQEIKITGATVFVNPYKDEEEAERKAAEEARLKVAFWRILCAAKLQKCAHGYSG
jgi:peptidyl-prolyl cis-trans isomerase-like protein 2